MKDEMLWVYEAEIKSKIQLLHDLQKQVNYCKESITKFKDIVIDRYRSFKDGEIAEVWHCPWREDETPKKIGEAIVMGADIYIGKGEYEIERYLEKPDSLVRDAFRILYKMNKIKKNGTASQHSFHYKNIPEIKQKGEYYLVKKQPTSVSLTPKTEEE